MLTLKTMKWNDYVKAFFTFVVMLCIIRGCWQKKTKHITINDEHVSWFGNELGSYFVDSLPSTSFFFLFSGTFFRVKSKAIYYPALRNRMQFIFSYIWHPSHNSLSTQREKPNKFYQNNFSVWQGDPTIQVQQHLASFKSWGRHTFLEALYVR